jgi:hypothetical protein
VPRLTEEVCAPRHSLGVGAAAHEKSAFMRPRRCALTRRGADEAAGPRALDFGCGSRGTAWPGDPSRAQRVVEGVQLGHGQPVRAGPGRGVEGQLGGGRALPACDRGPPVCASNEAFEDHGGRAYLPASERDHPPAARSRGRDLLSGRVPRGLAVAACTPKTTAQVAFTFAVQPWSRLCALPPFEVAARRYAIWRQQRKSSAASSSTR